MTAPVLRPYQVVGRDFLAAKRYALLADEMRVGKTPQAILAAHKAGAKSIQVVCPAIAVPQWRAEMLRWWPGETLPVFGAVSYDRARGLWRAGQTGRADLLIVDEAHYCKNPEAERTKMVYGKTGLGAACGAVWALSGTPAPRHAGELWPMLRAFGQTRMSYADWTRWACVVEPITLKVIGTKKKRIPELREILGRVMLRRTRKDVAPEMPDISYNFLQVESAGADLPEGMAGATADMLAQYAARDPGERQAVALSKIAPLADEIAQCIDAGDYAQTVVFGWHVEPLARLADLLAQRNVRADLLTGATPPARRVTVQENFRRGRTQVLCANIKAAGTAIDLSVASHGYFLELWWVGGDNVQAANRLVSLQKAEPVTFDVVTIVGSVDDAVHRTLARQMQELKMMGLA